MRFIACQKLPTVNARSMVPEAHQQLERCVRAEQLGYDGVHLTDSVIDNEAGLVFTTLLAGRTRRVSLVVGLSGGARLSQGWTILDLLTDRLELVRASDAPLCRPVLLADTDAQARRLAGAVLGGSHIEDPFWGEADGPLVGSPEGLIRGLRSLSSKPEDYPLLLDFWLDGLTAEQQLASMERFSREVMPHFRPQPLLPPTFA